jgi:hypothetical protein
VVVAFTSTDGKSTSTSAWNLSGFLHLKYTSRI